MNKNLPIKEWGSETYFHMWRGFCLAYVLGLLFYLSLNIYTSYIELTILLFIEISFMIFIVLDFSNFRNSIRRKK